MEENKLLIEAPRYEFHFTLKNLYLTTINHDIQVKRKSEIEDIIEVSKLIEEAIKAFEDSEASNPEEMTCLTDLIEDSKLLTLFDFNADDYQEKTICFDKCEIYGHDGNGKIELIFEK